MKGGVGSIARFSLRYGCHITHITFLTLQTRVTIAKVVNHISRYISSYCLFKFNFAGGCKASWLLVSLTFFFVCTAHTRRNWSMWGSTGVHLRIKQLQKPNFIFCHYVGTIIITNRDSCREKSFDIHDGSYSFLDSAACMKMGQGETILKWSR